MHTDVVIDVAQQSRRDRVSSSSPFPRLFVSLFHFRIQEEVNKRDHNGEGAYKNFSSLWLHQTQWFIKIPKNRFLENDEDRSYFK